MRHAAVGQEAADQEPETLLFWWRFSRVSGAAFMMHSSAARAAGRMPGPPGTVRIGVLEETMQVIGREAVSRCEIALASLTPNHSEVVLASLPPNHSEVVVATLPPNHSEVVLAGVDPNHSEVVLAGVDPNHSEVVLAAPAS
jgi:hypothetical protein